MPRTTKPRYGWRMGEDEPHEFSKSARAELLAKGLPAPAIKELSSIVGVVRGQISDKLPTNAEVRAGLKEVRIRLDSALWALHLMDEWTRVQVNEQCFVYEPPGGFLYRTANGLLDLFNAVERAEKDMKGRNDRAFFEMKITGLAYKVFRDYGLKWDSRPKGLAVAVVQIMLAAAGRRKSDARNYIRKLSRLLVNRAPC